jgi:hypothetical protein
MSNTLQEKIVANIQNAQELELLYRKNGSAFSNAFNTVYNEISQYPLAQGWNERLNYKQDDNFLFSKQDLIFAAITIFISGWIAKLPDLMGWNQDLFMSRNICFIFFEIILLFFAWKEKASLKKIAISVGIFLLACIYINLLPKDDNSQTILLSCIHLPIFLWSMVGFIFTGNQYNNPAKRIGFLRFNGDLVVMSAVISLSGALFTAITMNLFLLIGINIQQFFANYFVRWALPAIPIVSTILVRQNPQLVGKVSPIIAKIFSPLVFIMLTVFLIAVISTGKDPYNDREYLLLFNAMLIGVMAIILFSLTEVSKGMTSKWHLMLLLALSLLTIIDDGIAISAIMYRLSAFGVSPNRIAVLGSNVLILLNLVGVSYQIFRVLKFNLEITSVEKTIAFFLPVYSTWASVVAFILPFLFHLK